MFVNPEFFRHGRAPEFFCVILKRWRLLVMDDNIVVFKRAINDQFFDLLIIVE